jgi:tripartite-type tricarboxylate transporter receptor subunit TctC
MVPYRGLAPAFNDLLGSTLHMVSATPVELKPFIDGKKIKLIASSRSKPSQSLPNVEPIASLFPGHSIETWNGVVAPAATPAEIVNALAEDILAAQSDREFVGRLTNLGVDPAKAAREDFAKMISADAESWAKLMPEIGMSIQR